MGYSFEYIDIILLAMIAGFIFLRLRGILGKKTGHEENLSAGFHHDFSTKNCRGSGGAAAPRVPKIKKTW